MHFCVFVLWVVCSNIFTIIFQCQFYILHKKCKQYSHIINSCVVFIYFCSFKVSIMGSKICVF